MYRCVYCIKYPRAVTVFQKDSSKLDLHQAHASTLLNLLNCYTLISLNNAFYRFFSGIGLKYDKLIHTWIVWINFHNLSISHTLLTVGRTLCASYSSAYTPPSSSPSSSMSRRLVSSGIIDAQAHFPSYHYLLDFVNCIQTNKKARCRRLMRRQTDVHFPRTTSTHSLPSEAPTDASFAVTEAASTADCTTPVSMPFYFDGTLWLH